MNYKNITSIKQLRRKHKVSQEIIASLLGISVRNYREKENDYLPFNKNEMTILIAFFKLDCEDVFNLFFKNAAKIELPISLTNFFKFY